MKEQIKLISEAKRLNKPIFYNGKYVMQVYILTLNFKNGNVKIRCTDLEPEFVNIMQLEVKS